MAGPLPSSLRRRARWLLLCALLASCGSRHSLPSRRPQSKADAGRFDAGRSRAEDDAAVADAAADHDADAVHDAGSDAGRPLLPNRRGDDFLVYDPVSPNLDGSVTLAFDLPEDAVSFVLTADPKATPRRIDLLHVLAPDGASVFDVSGASPQPFDPGVASSVNDALPYSVMFPSSPETPFATGHYQVVLGIAAAPAGSDDALALELVWKRAPSPLTSGGLGLVLWFVQGAMLDAASAQSEPTLQAALSKMRDIYKGIGIDLSSIDYRDLTGAQVAKLSSVHDDGEFAELLTLLQPEAPTTPVVNLVFVDDLEVAPGQGQRGKSSGLPGPALADGSPRRGGVVLAISTLPASSQLLGELLAHETGHYLGLRHTSEYDGIRHDPIADTPECPAARATKVTSDGVHVLTAEDCADLDGYNLLFYTPPQGFSTQEALTPGQAFVLLRNPLVR
ncbi:MAG: hypothetical protein ACHQ53_15170 [Polyangiales bacterium]